METLLEMLVAMGELTLIMILSALLLGLAYMVKYAICKKPCDKK
jgi:hypothetical protein